MNFGNERESPHYERKYSIPEILQMNQDNYLLNPRGNTALPPRDSTSIREGLKDTVVHTILDHPMLRKLFGIKTYPANDGTGTEYYDWDHYIYWNGDKDVPPVYDQSGRTR